MAKTKPKYGQSNLDLAIQLSGQVDSLVDFCIKNGIENVDTVPDKTLEYEIKNINYAGFDYATNSPFLEPTEICAIVTGLVLDSFTGSSVSLSWNYVDNCGFEYFVTLGNDEPREDTGSLTFNNEITIPLSSGNYYFWVRSVCGYGNKSSFVSLELNTIIYLTTEDELFYLITEDGDSIIE